MWEENYPSVIEEWLQLTDLSTQLEKEIFDQRRQQEEMQPVILRHEEVKRQLESLREQINVSRAETNTMVDKRQHLKALKSECVLPSQDHQGSECISPHHIYPPIVV